MKKKFFPVRVFVVTIAHRSERRIRNLKLMLYAWVSETKPPAHSHSLREQKRL